MNLFPRLSQSTDFDNLIERFFSPTEKSDSNFFSPKVDVTESGDQFQISAEIPGVKKEDVSLEIHDGMLTLSAELKQEDKEEKEGKILRQERRYGKYQRAFHVGDQVDASDIEARFDNGVLTIQLPKVESQLPEKRRVTIN